MNAELAITTQNDGWADAAKDAEERIIRGTLLKFSDGRWSKGKEGTPVEDGTQLVAIDTAVGWVRWVGGKPDRYVMRQPGRKLPEREELGDLDESEWEIGPNGEPRDPWQLTRFVYLVDPVTAEFFTFSTSSWGGRIAVIDLADQVGRMRCAHPGAVPVVELSVAPMVTRFGRKSRPLFRVTEWKAGGTVVSDEAKPAQLEDRTAADSGINRYAEIKGRRPTEVTLSDLDDEIPY
jgi:hypothetical protein